MFFPGTPIGGCTTGFESQSFGVEMSDPRPERPSLPQALLPLGLAALGAALAAQLLSRSGRLWLPLLVLGASLVLPGVLGRLHMRKVFMTGQVEELIRTWQAAMGMSAQARALAPLVRATAYAAYGWTEAARDALNRLGSGPLSAVAAEQRLFVEALLDAFEGDRQSAIRKAAALEAMATSVPGRLARRRVQALRRGLAALTRAFGHVSQVDDAESLDRASKASPLVHWAMRYAAAIVAIDSGRAREVATLLASAPKWPEESAFRAYHEELLSRAALVAAERP